MEILNSDLQAQLIGFIQVIIGGCLSIGSNCGQVQKKLNSKIIL